MGYNEKDFRKNTAEFKKQLASLNEEINEAQLRRRLDRRSDVNITGALNTLLMDLEEDSKNFDSKKKKNYEKIDDRIREMIGLIRKDISNNSIQSAMMHVLNLNDIIYAERKYGEAQPDDVVLGKKNFSKLMSQKLALCDKRDRLEKELAETKMAFKKLFAADKNNAKLKDIQSAYNRLQEEFDAVNEDISLVDRSISNDKTIQIAKERDEVTAAIAGAATPSAVANKILNDVVTRRQKVVIDVENVEDLTKGFKEEMGSSVKKDTKRDLFDEAEAEESAREMDEFQSGMNDIEPSFGSLFDEMKKENKNSPK